MTGSEYLSWLRKSARQMAVSSIIETAIAVAIGAFLFVSKSYILIQRPPNFREQVLLAVIGVLAWIGVAAALTHFASRSYREHFRRNLRSKGMLLTLMENSESESFAGQTAKFFNKYRMLAEQAQLRPYPLGWRTAEICTLVASYFFLVLFIGLTAIWVFEAVQGLVVPGGHILPMGLLAILSFAFKVTVNRPQQYMLWVAVADELSSDRSE